MHRACINSTQHTTADLINIHAWCIALCIMHVCLWDQLLCAGWCCCDHSDELGCFSPGRNTNHSFCFLIFDIHVSTVYIQYVYNIYWMVLVWWSSRLDAFSPGAFHSPHQCWINRVKTQTLLIENHFHLDFNQNNKYTNTKYKCKYKYKMLDKSGHNSNLLIANHFHLEFNQN